MVASIPEVVNGDQEWPSLNRRQDEWELLEQEQDEEEGTKTPPTTEPREEDSFEVIIEADALQSGSLRRHLRHCNSSPNLSSPPSVDATNSALCQSPGSNKSVTSTNLLSSVVEDEEESSFAMVSGPPSVWTSASNSGLNFRDAILASPAGGATRQQPVDRSCLSPSAAAGYSSGSVTSPVRNKACGLRKFQPRFVVVPTPPRIRRCSRSTGDLPSLVLLDEQQLQQHQHGSEDANEFYQQKSMGMTSYSVGRKLRPDEAKRRNFIIQKKEQQRQGNQ